LTSQNGIVIDLRRGGTWEKSLLMSLEKLIDSSFFSMGQLMFTFIRKTIGVGALLVTQ